MVKRKTKVRGPFDDLAVETKSFRSPLHPPFEGKRRAEVERQHAILKDVYISDLENYELGFRGDVHPDREIGIWKTIADGFLAMTSPEMSLDRKKAYFGAVFASRLTTRDKLVLKRLPAILSSAEKNEIIDHMYGIYGEPLPVVFYLFARPAA